MPDRPPSHVLEDTAAAKFVLAMRPRWLVREKTKDYGVDLEAELLTNDGTRPGNIFFVQSKATDDEYLADSVRIKVDRLEYLASFEVPAMVVRYSDATESSYWMWATEALTLAKPGAGTVTLRFDDHHQWTEETVPEIERTMPILKLLKCSDYRVSFPLKLAKGGSVGAAIQTQRVVDSLANDLSFLRMGMGEVPIQFRVDGSSITMSIERIISLQLQARSTEFDDLVSASGYLLANLLVSLQQNSQARKAAMWCLASGTSVGDDVVAADVSSALMETPSTAVDLALLNSLHEKQGFGHVMFRVVLASPFWEGEETKAAATKFYDAAIAAHVARGESVGEIRYSFANILTHANRLGTALSHYNKARKDQPEYWSRAYFLSELGGLLFCERRYRKSSRAYRCAAALEPSEKAWFCLGDAEMYAGNWNAAVEAFAYAVSSKASPGAEARLKRTLAMWATTSGVPAINDWDALLLRRGSAISSMDVQAAFWSHLAISFLLGNDVACWADAIYLAFRVDAGPLLLDVILMSVQRTRLEAYALFKVQRGEALAEAPEQAEQIDRFVLGLTE
ncbi:DUF4365 domain-containing protein [Rhizobium rhizogenes]|uniref:DUF4365 domain-containing protein n=1 Tax=Rhizobium rhizogenes TaxID=359 RepID=UPI0015732FAA|nr:DUF4365 domain-containing protein [Rhizobium rhizogenes]NTH22935.1 DUF4365 domain-containing protein [Rhizobium rhizogenes]NTH35964.1 DUF4365 domain-containing protein [Rhizobium rhizogenes]